MRINKFKGNANLIYPLAFITFVSITAFLLLYWFNDVSIKYKWQQYLYILNDSLERNVGQGYLLTDKMNSTNAIYYINNNIYVKKVCSDAVRDGCWPSESYFNNGSLMFLNGAPGYILPNGIMVSVVQLKDNGCDNNTGICDILNVDFNGKYPPNKFGVDEFRFYLYRDKVVYYLPFDDKNVGTKAKDFGGLK